MESKKVSDVQLAELRAIQARYQELVSQYGELKYDQLVLNARLEGLEAAMLELEADRLHTVQKLQGEFGGTGHVNLETGEFIS